MRNSSMLLNINESGIFTIKVNQLFSIAILKHKLDFYTLLMRDKFVN